MVGVENVIHDDYARIKASYGKALIDVLRLREGIIENLPGLVLHPRNKHDVQEIIQYCSQNIIPVYVVSGGSSVTRGFEAVKGGVSLDLTTHLNSVIKINEIDQTVTVQPGIFGPALEATLNQAKTTLSTQRNYTCGHFPQSFEYSTVGGWISTRSAGQNSTYYGKIEDLVISQEYVTPAGTITTNEWPRAAIGPDMDQILIGSEGIFGVLVEATLKIFRHMPENKSYFSFMFKSWEDSLHAAREILQVEAGNPSVFRISDPEETDIAMHLYKITGSPADKFLTKLGYHPMSRCLMLGYTNGEKKFSHNLKRAIKQICRQYASFNLSMFGVTQRWEHSRFLDPYMRDDLGDFGVITETLECSVTWDKLHEIYFTVRKTIKEFPDTICMTHLSHAYPQGGNLYFIFMTKYRGIKDFLAMQYAILDAIQQSGASMSHHHGLGKHLAPWLPEQVGPEHMQVLKALKDYFDPNNIMNPGGTLGLDMSKEQRSKNWGL
jgi:alkyldihydroxyacetonephosphate synthase